MATAGPVRISHFSTLGCLSSSPLPSPCADLCSLSLKVTGDNEFTQLQYAIKALAQLGNGILNCARAKVRQPSLVLSLPLFLTFFISPYL